MNIRNSILASALALVAGVSFQASAAETSSTFQVTATVASSCAILGADELSFGNYDAVVANKSSDLKANSKIQVRCNGGTTAAVRLDEGVNKFGTSSCGMPVRQLSDGAAGRLKYYVAKTSAFQDSFGCDADSEATVAFANLETKDVSLYGRLEAGQNAPVGTYADTVTVSVLF